MSHRRRWFFTLLLKVKIPIILMKKRNYLLSKFVIFPSRDLWLFFLCNSFFIFPLIFSICQNSKCTNSGWIQTIYLWTESAMLPIVMQKRLYIAFVVSYDHSSFIKLLIIILFSDQVFDNVDLSKAKGVCDTSIQFSIFIIYNMTLLFTVDWWIYDLSKLRLYLLSFIFLNGKYLVNWCSL